MPDNCTWKHDGDGGYYVTCQDLRVIMACQRDFDDNTEHEFDFCPYCGKSLIVRKTE